MSLQTAMIFCAGLGTRFKPWTDRHPKALAIVNGKSLLQRNIEYLQQFGINRVVVNVHHFAQQVIDALTENKGWGSEFIISDEQDLVLETGGGLLKAKHLFTPGESFLTLNVDILTDLDIAAFYNFHRKNQSLISLAVSDRKTSRCFVFDDYNRLTGWRNLQTGEERMSIPTIGGHNKAFSGISIFNYDFFNFLRLQGKFSLVDAYLGLAKGHLIAGFDHSGGKWVDVGKPETVAVAEGLFP